MVTTAIIAVFWAIVSPILNLLPDITFSAVSISVAVDYLRAVCYFFPMQTITIVLGLVLALWIFRIVIAFLKSIWQALPFV